MPQIQSIVFCLLFSLVFVQEPPYVPDQIPVKGADAKSAISRSGCIYIIDSAIDLKGAEITIPKNSILRFKRNGKLLNGIIIGDYTELVGLRKACLGVTMKGTWSLATIKDSFFDYDLLTDNIILDNIYTLQSATIRNKIILTKPTYRIVLDSNRDRGLQLKNNAVLDMRTSLHIEGNSLPYYAVIFVGNNSIIIGGEIVGDVGHHVYAEGTTSEWGFGILVNRAENVSIMGTRISKCTGDGIYIGGGTTNEIGDYSLASKNITIKNVVSTDNRRQGISITCADGVLLESCVFSNTGKTEFTSPGCGLDIEPNKGQSVRNVVVKKCKILNNNKVLDASIGGYQTVGNKCNVENIRLEDCEITGPLCICTGSVTLKRCSMSTLNLHLAKMPKEKVYLYNCTISGGSGIILRSVGNTNDNSNIPLYSFKSCSIDMDNVLTRAMFSTINHKGNEVASFVLDRCRIQFPGGNQKYEMIQSNSCSFKFVRCGINSQGRPLEREDKMFENCTFRN